MRSAVAPVALRLDARLANLPTLSMALLRNSGLFSSTTPNTIGFQLDRSSTLVVELIEDGNIIRLTWEHKYKLFEQRVKTVRVGLNLGSRALFICLLTWDRCDRLFLSRARWASRYAVFGSARASPAERRRASYEKRVNRLLGSDGRGPARGNNRRQIVAELKACPWLRLVDPELADQLDLESSLISQGRANGMRASVHSSRLSCGAGFAAGSVVRIDDRNRSWPDRWRGERGKPLAGRRALAREFVEQFPTLTMRGLTAAKLLVKGALKAMTLTWPGFPTYIIECHLEDLTELFIVVRTTLGDGTDQLIQLSPDANGRLYMLCPFTGQRSSTLYLREGLFGSKSANCLINRSQKKFL